MCSVGENDQGVYGSRLHVTNLVVEKQSGQRLPKSVLRKKAKNEYARTYVNQGRAHVLVFCNNLATVHVSSTVPSHPSHKHTSL